MKTFAILYTKSRLIQILFGAFVISLSNIAIIYFHFLEVSSQQQLTSTLVFMIITLILSVIGPRVYWLGYGLAVHSLITGSISDNEVMRITITQQATFTITYLLIMVIATLNYEEKSEQMVTSIATPASPKYHSATQTTDIYCDHCGTQSKDKNEIHCKSCGAPLPKRKPNE